MARPVYDIRTLYQVLHPEKGKDPDGTETPAQVQSRGLVARPVYDFRTLYQVFHPKK